jgi:hypothetical protein
VGLAKADHSSEDSYGLYKKDYKTEEETRAQQWAVEPLMNEWGSSYNKTVFCTIAEMKWNCTMNNNE